MLSSRKWLLKSKKFYQSYKKELATFGAEPLPLPPQAEGPEGVLWLFEWLLSEFEGLQEIAETVGDNAAAIACEGLMAILKHAGCADVEKLALRGFEFPTYGELASDLESVQGLKKVFFRRFWMVSRREVVRVVAAAQLEAISVFDGILDLCFLFFGVLTLCLYLAGECKNQMCW